MKLKHMHVIEGTIKVYISFDPDDLESAMRAQSTIKNISRHMAPAALISCETRMTKVPVPEKDSPAAAGLPAVTTPSPAPAQGPDSASASHVTNSAEAEPLPDFLSAARRAK